MNKSWTLGLELDSPAGSHAKWGLAAVALRGEESWNSLATSFPIFIAGTIQGWGH